MNIKFIVYVLLVFLMLLAYTNCEKSPTNYYITKFDDMLTNPDSLPRIIFTNPADGAVGPFGIIDPTEYPTTPRITIQFNKLINILDINDKNISLMSGDKSFRLTLSDRSYTNSGYLYSAPNLRDILIFDVETRYKPNKQYVLTIDTTLQDIHGYTLNEPYTISYTPEPHFRVFYVSPSSENVGPETFYQSNSQIYISFNSSVDSSIYNCLSISPSINGNWSQKVYYYGDVDSSYVYFTPTDTLLYETTYTISVSGEAKDAQGLSIQNPYHFSFTTSPFSVRWSSASSTNEKLYYINFWFNCTVDTSTVRHSINVTPPLSYNLSYIYRGNGQYDEIRLSFYDAVFTPNTSYKITLEKTIRSTKGDYLKEPYSYTYYTYD